LSPARTLVRTFSPLAVVLVLFSFFICLPFLFFILFFPAVIGLYRLQPEKLTDLTLRFASQTFLFKLLVKQQNAPNENHTLVEGNCGTRLASG
jgi:hypothetical protein